MKKDIEFPRYANNADTRIEFDIVHYDDENNRQGRHKGSTNKGSKEFARILETFGEDEIQRNKLKVIGEIERQKKQLEHEKNDYEKKSEQGMLFKEKSFWFGTRLVHECSNKQLRRKIRKAQTLQEIQMIVNVIMMEELFGLSADAEKLSELLTRVDVDD